jgi:hypothetical protein
MDFDSYLFITRDAGKDTLPAQLFFREALMRRYIRHKECGSDSSDG